ncbi:MAG TPA: hypothetical protein VGO03_04790 [Acidimicrobiia bacterium]|jgi:hypothetical protein
MPDDKKRPRNVPMPGLPGDPMVVAANGLLAEAGVRDQVRQMHASGRPLVQMVEDLGLDAEMDEGIRKVLENLSPEVVEGIRQATLEMFDRADGYTMPLDCDVESEDLTSAAGVDVSIEDEQGTKTIRVRGPQGRALA